MSIILVGKIKFRRGKESLLPGSPISTSPPVFNKPLAVGEPAFSTDTGRMFIGHTPNVGDINYQRTTFPYQNIEVLTEASPVNQQLFNQFYMDQNRNDFFVPTVIPGLYSGPILFSDYSNTLAIPTRLDGNIISAKFEYHGFYIDGSSPTKSGVVQVMAAGNSTVIQDTQNTIIDVDSLTFSISALSQDKDGPYYMLGVTNNTVSDVNLFLRKVNIGLYGTPIAPSLESFGMELEDGSGEYELEDGSGYIELEVT
jgi:hypothetical protein